MFRFDLKALEHEIALWLARNDIFQQSLFSFELKQIIFIIIMLIGFLLAALVARATLPIIFSTKAGCYTFLCLSVLLLTSILIIEGNAEYIYRILPLVAYFGVLYGIIRRSRNPQGMGSTKGSCTDSSDDIALANAIYGIPDGSMVKM